MANFYGELIIRFTSDTTGLARGVKESQAQVASMGKTAERSLGKTGLAMQNVGRTMTQYYTLPVVAGLGVATYMAYKYSKSMIQVQNLTGLSAEQANRFSDSIREMAAEIGVAPQAAAEAFYFIASSGFSAKEAVDALSIAMKASVAGMGDVQTTADVITSAVNAYGHANLTAAHAMDVLMRTIEVGKAEPEALASSLGRIMPIANQLSVGIEDLGGMVAALTLGGLSSAEAVTSLRGTLVALVSPAKMSIDQLKTMGLSYQEVTRSIAREGLLPTLKMLWEATDHNMLSMRKIIPNVRATAGVMSLLGANYKKNLEVIAKVNDAEGKLNQTYRTAAETDVVKFDRALAQLKSTLIEVGQASIPIATELLEVIGKLASAFTSLPEGVQTATAWFLAITAAMFPLLSIAGSITRAYGLLITKQIANAVATQAQVVANQRLYASEIQVATAQGIRTMAIEQETGALYGLNAASTTARVGMLGWLGALAAAGAIGAIGGIAIGRALTAKPLTEEEWRALLEPNIPEVSVPIKYVPGDTKKVKEKIEKMRLAGKIVLSADDTQAWETLHGLAAYVKDKGRWKLVIDAHSALRAFVKSLGKDGYPIPAHFSIEDVMGQVDKLGRPLAAHKVKGALKIEAEAIWDEMQIKNIFEKRPPVKVPVEFEAMSKAQREAFYKTLQPDEVLQIKWQLEQVKSGFTLPTIEGQDTLTLGQRLVLDYVSGMEDKRALAVGKAGQISGGVTAMLSKAKDNTWTYGSQAAWGFAGGVGDEAARAAAVANAASLVDAVQKELDRGDSPWPSTQRMGVDFVDGFTQGVKDGTARAVEAVSGMADTAMEAAPPAYEMGLKIAAGVADGIKAGTRDVLDASSAMASGIKADATKAVAASSSMAKDLLAAQSGVPGYKVQVEPMRGGAVNILRPSSTYAGNRSATPLAVTTARGRRQQEVTIETGEREVHYHSHLALPQGIVVSDLDRFGRTMAPYIERSTLLARRRRQRGRATL